MSRASRFVLGLCVAAACVCAAAAQDSAPVPKVLQITREYVKPGKAGTIHEKTESAFVEAMQRAKWPTHYIGMTSLSGKSRVLFFTSYDSFEAWQKDSDATDKNAALSAALERAYEADGELLDEMDQGAFYFREEMSLRPRADLSQFRYMALTVFHVKPGKIKEWEEVVKLAKDGYEKGVPDAHWGMFEQVYGGDGGTFLLLTGHKTLAEIDKAFADGKQFQTAMGEEGMKKLHEIFGNCVSQTQQQLFAFNPHMSYVPEEWIKAYPDFWKAAKASAAKPAAEKKEKQ
jgi:hypothetical protein